jgi:hypothetical protein
MSATFEGDGSVRSTTLDRVVSVGILTAAGPGVVSGAPLAADATSSGPTIRSSGPACGRTSGGAVLVLLPMLYGIGGPGIAWTGIVSRASAGPSTHPIISVRDRPLGGRYRCIAVFRGRC